ncbi:DMT family protein [Couchioplanes azureus]|uniref:hypothetical protein n=1 Tax=Couchioplanes caeruleus TaxID=56438 RepID=UPI0016700CD0|nr:hypothetical protein [Couchioplanes caeruleus]GGQ68328.1 hypothetical protein GCM10010166_42950 [Couchioplanes caeruleus subsp. azureus]
MEVSEMPLIAVSLCVASALSYAAAAVLQERIADRPATVLLRTSSWWVAIGLNGGGAALHVVALRYGPLSLVQPLGVITLVLAVALGAWRMRRAVTRSEWHGIALTVAGLGGIMVLAGSAGDVGVLSAGHLIGLLLVAAAVLTALGGWSAVPGASGLWAAAAGGVAFGVSSALTQTVAVHIAGYGFGALLRPFVALAAIAVGVLACAGLLFAQRSYRAGLAAPLAVVALANPVAAATVGLVLLGERIVGGTVGVAVAGMSALAAGTGVALLSRARADEIPPVGSAYAETK